jgi:hypothetical protein
MLKNRSKSDVISIKQSGGHLAAEKTKVPLPRRISTRPRRI